MNISALATQLISSAVIGLATWLGGLLLQQLKSGDGAMSRAVNGFMTRAVNGFMTRAAASVTRAAGVGGVHSTHGIYVPAGMSGMNGAATPAPPVWPVPGTPPSAPMTPNAATGPQPSRPAIDVKVVALHIAGLQFGASVMGFLVGVVVFLLAGGQPFVRELNLAALLLIGTVVLSAGFFAIAMMVPRAERWQHLTYVAVGTAAAMLIVNTLFGAGATTFAVFVFVVLEALCQTFLAMVIGGGLATLATKDSAARYPGPAPIWAWPGLPYAQPYTRPYANGPAGAYGYGAVYGYGPGPSGPPRQPTAASVPFSYPGMPQYPPAPPFAPGYAPSYTSGYAPVAPQYPQALYPAARPPYYQPQPVPAGVPAPWVGVPYPGFTASAAAPGYSYAGPTHPQPQPPAPQGTAAQPHPSDSQGADHSHSQPS